MKIKRILSAIAVCVLVVSMCVGIAACAPNAKGVKGEQITETEWVAAFEKLASDDSKFVVECYAKASVAYKQVTTVHKTKWTATTTESYTYTKNGSNESKIGYNKISYSGNKASAENEVGKVPGKTQVELYSQITDDGIYNYEKNLNEKWEKDEASKSVIAEDFYYITYLKNSFDSFEYSKEHNGYVAKGYKKGDDITVYKFQKAKLVAVYMYAEDFDENSNSQQYDCTKSTLEMHITINYITKAVKLPSVR